MTETNFKKANKEGRDVSTYKAGAALFKERILKKIKDTVKGLRRREMVARALSFSRVNRESLVIIGDTKKDTLILAYNEKFMTVDIQSKFLHLNHHVIDKAINKKFEGLTDEQKKETIYEFTNVMRTAIMNFIEHINEPIKPKVVLEKTKDQTNNGKEN